MKTRTLIVAAGAILISLTARQTSLAGACLAARFHDWNDMGCNQTYGGAGGPAAPGSCASKDCDQGMPRWWVTEPYINLHVSDTPLSYHTSSGQEMAFQFTHHQRTRLPEDDEIPNYNYYLNGALQYSRQDFNATGMACGTNAVWNLGWNLSVQIWDPTWESSWTQVGSQLIAPPLATYPVYSRGYQAMVFQPSGGIDYYNVQTGNMWTINPKSLDIFTNNAAGYSPQVAIQTKIGGGSIQKTNEPTADGNGIYWGDPGIGVRLLHPDGSQDVFALSGNLATAAPVSASGAGAFGTSTERLLLTQRIDPQGRVTQLGYERATNVPAYSFNMTSYGFRLRYVVDSDDRTNTILYTSGSGLQISEVDDPYGRKARLTYTNLFASWTAPDRIIDAAGMTNLFSYQGQKTNGWITSLTTPYGPTRFNYYELRDPDVTAYDSFQQRAIYVSEPESAQQLYFYQHQNPNFVPATETSPIVPGQTNFDDGTLTGISGHQAMTYRDTFHWGRRQYAALSSAAQSGMTASLSYQFSNPSYSQSLFASALGYLATADYNKADEKHWLLLGGDLLSITESLSSQRDPSPDSAGQIAGLRTWYNYAGKSSPELLGGDPRITCVARTLPDGNSQYAIYNYKPIPVYPLPITAGSGFVSNRLSSYSLPDGTIGVLTHWFTYAANNIDLLNVSNSAGQYLNYGYNTSHQITAITNALNQVTTLSWDGYTHNFTGGQLPAGKSVSLSYYAAVIPPTATSAMLQQLTVQPEGRSFTVNNYSAGLPASVTDDRGLTVANTWDGLNRPTGTVFPDNTTFSNVYYRLDLVATKDRLNHWSSFAFDGLQHLTNYINANNATNAYSYCGCGSLNSIIDALGNPTYLNYDNQGNLTNVVFPDYSSLIYQFDLAGRMTNAFDGAGRFVQIGYNNQGLPTSVATANGSLRTATFDALNRPISVTDANGVTVTNQFDALNELLKRTWPDGIGEGFGYSAAGLIAYTNRDQKVTRYGLDGAGRMLAVTNANTEVTQFSYDSLNNIVSLIDGLLHQTTWQYNQYGWLTNKVDGLNRNIERFALNANGWITNRWTPEKGNTGYAYDNVGNLKSIAYPQQTISYAYDVLNRLTNMVDGVGSHAFGWTATGQLAGESDAWTTINYTYQQGLRTSMAIGSWNQSYNYDAAWRMTNTASPAGAFAYQFLTPNSYLPTSIALPNGAKIVNSYDSLARLKETDLNNYWSHTLDGYGYQRDPLGLATNIMRNFGMGTNNVSVGYDNIVQITSWNARELGGALRQNEQLGLGYDAAHNLHTRVNGGLTQTFTADAANQLNSVTRSGSYTFTGATPAPATGITVNGQAAQIYNDQTFAATNLTLVNGNNTFTVIATNAYGVKTTNVVTVNLPQSVSITFDNNSSLTNDGALLYGYDAENQLTNITVAGSWKSDFVYDGLNRRRIERDYFWNGSGWTKTNEIRFIHDGYLLVQERDSNNVVKVTYTRGLDFSGSLQGAGGVCGLLARTDASGTVFYHSDAVGNITALMDGAENIVGRYLYGPGGNIMAMSGPMAFVNVMRSFSEPTHPMSGLLHLPFRDVNLRIPTFLTADPRGESGGIPLHGFVNNNGLRYVDPWGWQAEERDVRPEPAPEIRPPSQMFFPNGERRPESYEERLRDQLDREAGAEALRRQGLDPNQTYIGPRPEDAKPATCPRGGVYALRDPEDNVMYVGRSKDLQSRQSNWRRDPIKGQYDFDPLYRTDNYAEQRGLEQKAYDQYQPPLNKINPISPGNANYMNYLSSAESYINKAK